MKEKEQSQRTKTIGTLIKARLKENHHSIVWLSDQLGCSRTTIYNIFKRKTIDTGELMKISLTLNYDFFKIYSDDFMNKTRKNS